jgi:hypothetical protein
MAMQRLGLQKHMLDKLSLKRVSRRSRVLQRFVDITALDLDR